MALGMACDAAGLQDALALVRPNGGGVPVDSAPDMDERFSLSLDGPWNFVQDPENVGLQQDWPAAIARSGSPPPSAGAVSSMNVPRAFESRQSAGVYDGVVWYWRHVVLPRPTGMRTVLAFERVNHACQVWINGHFVGQHTGGYDPFELDVSEAVASARKLELVVRVVDPGGEEIDGLSLATVPHSKESWYENFGGILGPVSLRGHADVQGRIERVVPDPETGRVHVDVSLRAPDDGRSRHVEVELRARPLALRSALPEGDDFRPPALAMARHRVNVHEGRAEISMTVDVPGHQLWEPESPWRYLMGLQVHGDARAEQADDERPFGFRTVQLGTDGFILNGIRRSLLGVLYQPHYVGLGGLYPSSDFLRQEVQQMLEVGFNLVRAHVRPAPTAFLDACDRYGLMVLEEPSIGWVDMSPKLEGWLKDEVEWMVRRDQHHPSIVMWGVLNELSGDAHLLGWPVTQHLVSLDATRPVLEDSGGFFRSRYVPAGGDALELMLDEHIYPPCPIPFAERERMLGLSAPEGPVFVSEFGYGALLDTEADVAEFESRGVLGVERNTFDAMRIRTRASVAARDTWDELAWRDSAQAVHAGMTADMVELLRANPRLVGSVYTQWQSVSSEASAGLLEAWGDPRPAYDAMAKALAPLQLTVLPAQASCTVGELQRVDVAVVNDTGAALEGSVVLNATGAVRHVDGAVGRGFDWQVFPPGVTRLSEEAFRMSEPGTVEFRAYLADASGEVMVASRAKTQVVVSEAPKERRVMWGPDGDFKRVRLVLPEGSAALTAFAQREGFGLSTLLDPEEAIPVVAIEQPLELGDSVSAEDLLRIWRTVWEGGLAVVFMGDLPHDHIGRIAGSRRGVRLLPHLPVRLGVGLAAGNFMGRTHAILERDEPHQPGALLPMAFERPRGEEPRIPEDSHPRLLQSDEASLAPGAMLVGAPPERTRAAAITLNHFRQKMGTSVAAVPYGKGQLLFVGMPLLEPVAGAPDARRDRVLADLILSLAHEAYLSMPDAASRARPLPLDERQLATYAEHMSRLSRLCAVADRYSFVTFGAMAPRSLVTDAIVRRDQALARVFHEEEQAWELLEQAFTGTWSAETEHFVEREEQTLAQLKQLILKATAEARGLGARVVHEWGHGVMGWIRGDPAEAHARLDFAEELLESAP